ncbi:MAG: phenylalanine--tRNA ligase subunit beta [Nevskiaceae bacterium]
MRISLAWLRERANPRATDAELAARLTRAGLECEVESAPAALKNVVVGAIRTVRPHPQADRLRVCEVDFGARLPATIVCGAANAREGMKAPVALPGATLPDGTEIRVSALRGVESAGMLCSARELGLAEKSDGLLELDAGARIGQPLAKHLGLDDAVLALELTPNRGDCLSVAGLAREVAAVFALTHKDWAPKPAPVTGKSRVEVRIDSTKDCPRYAGRVIENLDPKARTPDWMRERLRRSGIRSIYPVVDITNYVMLELGQPLHAFDSAKLAGGIRVRRAKAGESLLLLDERTYEFTRDDLLIADAERPLALAGVMGGKPSGVSPETTSIFFESACFAPELVAATGRRLRLPSDALYRFERGVDPSLQRQALERATGLVLQICGGQAGPVTEAGITRPKPVSVKLRHEYLNRLLGQEIPAADVERLLKRVGLGLKRLGKTGWQAAIPPHRYDLRLEVDLIEEVARLYGYECIPVRAYAAELPAAPVPECRPLDLARDRLAARGWQEVVTYSFVDQKLEALLAPGAGAIALDNPIADTLALMRTTLWSGLIPAWRYNQQRQRKRVRLFEIGVCFTLEPPRERGGGSVQGSVVEVEKLALLAAGAAAPEQWGLPGRPVDFFDLKGDLEALAAGLGFERGEHPALHPGQTARITAGGNPVGWLGTLHPRLVRELDLAEAPVLLEVATAALAAVTLPRPVAPSEFPASRRDLALVLREEVPAATLLAQVRQSGGGLLRETGVFDVYHGEGLPNGFKSVALSLIFQDNSRTLTDDEVEAAVQAVTQRLQSQFGATIRGDSGGGVDQGGTGGSPV